MKKIYTPSVKGGLPPGSSVYSGHATNVPVVIHRMQYTEETLKEEELGSAKEACAAVESGDTTWINVTGLHDVALVEELGLHIGLHPLTIEDILHTHQRPKMEDMGDSIYFVSRMLSLHPKTKELQSEQVSFVLHGNALITFQEQSGDVFDGIRSRLRLKQGRIRRKGADYLLYCLMDIIIDHYFKVLEYIGERIEEVETALMDDSCPSLLTDLYALKRELLYIRKFVWPLREAVSLLDRAESDLMEEGLTIYLRDLHDHTIQVIDTIEAFRDMLSSVQDLSLSIQGNKMNQVMKVLTIISTIFIPITFVAGIYGMNFEQMPELHWKYSYPTVWLIMVLMICGMLVYFRRKKWL